MLYVFGRLVVIFGRAIDLPHAEIGRSGSKEAARREECATPVGRETYTLAGADAQTGTGLADPVSLNARQMIGRYQADGAIAPEEELTRLLSPLATHYQGRKEGRSSGSLRSRQADDGP